MKRTNFQFCDPSRLLSLLDINNEKPEIYIYESNRSDGKTTAFAHKMIEDFLSKGSKFVRLYRNGAQLKNCGEAFFKDIGFIYYPNYKFETELIENNFYSVFKLNGSICGYAVSMNAADKVKDQAALFNDVSQIWLDEFQSETSHYIVDEVHKFKSIHDSIARGKGKQVRYVPVYLTGNPITLLNPYYTALSIPDRIRSNTHFIRGNGWVMERYFNENAGKSRAESAFSRAFGNDQYNSYTTKGSYLNDSSAFIEKLSGKSRYVCTLKFASSEYAIRFFDELGYAYCDKSVDPSYPIKIVVETADHETNYVMLKKSSYLLDNLRYYFEHGSFRFKNLACKQAIISALAFR